MPPPLRTNKGANLKSEAPHPESFLAYAPLIWYREFFAALLFLIALVIFRLDGFLKFSDGFIGGVTGDAGLYVWLFKIHINSIFNTPWFETPALYPYSYTLAWSDNFLLPGLIGQILVTLGASDVVAYNLITLATTFLSGFLTYWIVIRLTGSSVSAISSGLSFMTFPFISGMLGHPQLGFTFFIPLGAISLLRFIRTQSLGSAFGFGLILTAAFATTVYYAIFLIFSGLTLYGGLLLLRPGWLTGIGHIKLIFGVALGSLLLIPMVPPYLSVANAFGERHLYEAFYFAATALSFLSAPPDTLLYGATSILSHEEARLFPGLILIFTVFVALLRISEDDSLKRLRCLILTTFLFCCLTSAAATITKSNWDVELRYLVAGSSWALLFAFTLLLIRLGRLERKSGENRITERELLAAFGLLALVSFIVALGPLGNPEKGEYAFGLYRLWYTFLPGFDSIRAIGRIGILTSFCLSICLGILLSSFIPKISRARLLTWFIPLFIATENLHPLVPVEGDVAKDEVHRVLSGFNPSDGAVIVLPYTGELGSLGTPVSWGDFARRNIQVLLHLSGTGWRSVNGYSGQKSKIMREFPRQLRGFPDRRSLATICSIGGIRYLIYSSANDPEFNRETFYANLDPLDQQIRFITEDKAGNFLFSLPCLLTVDNERELLFPANLEANVSLFLAAPRLAKDKTAELKISAIVGDEEYPIDLVSVQGGEAWHEVTFALPKHDQSMRPVRVRFINTSSEQILIKDTKYQVTENRSWLRRTFDRFAR